MPFHGARGAFYADNRNRVVGQLNRIPAVRGNAFRRDTTCSQERGFRRGIRLLGDFDATVQEFFFVLLNIRFGPGDCRKENGGAGMSVSRRHKNILLFQTGLLADRVSEPLRPFTGHTENIESDQYRRFPAILEYARLYKEWVVGTACRLVSGNISAHRKRTGRRYVMACKAGKELRFLFVAHTFDLPAKISGIYLAGV